MNLIAYASSDAVGNLEVVAICPMPVANSRGVVSPLYLICSVKAV